MKEKNCYAVALTLQGKTTSRIALDIIFATSEQEALGMSIEKNWGQDESMFLFNVKNIQKNINVEQEIKTP